MQQSTGEHFQQKKTQPGPKPPERFQGLVCSWHLKEFSASRMERQAGAILHKMSKAMVRNFYFILGRSEVAVDFNRRGA